LAVAGSLPGRLRFAIDFRKTIKPMITVTRPRVTDADIDEVLHAHGFVRFGIHERWLNTDQGAVLREIVRQRLAGEEASLNGAARNLGIPAPTARSWRHRYAAFRSATDGALAEWNIESVGGIPALRRFAAMSETEKDAELARLYPAPPAVSDFLDAPWGIPNDAEADNRWWQEFQTLMQTGDVYELSPWMREQLTEPVAEWLASQAADLDADYVARVREYERPGWTPT
jgi:hypothetical protein